MKVHMNNFRVAALVALLTASVTGCKRNVSYTPVAREYIQPRTTMIIDSFIKEGKKITENPDFVYLGGDTLELNKDFSTNPSSFMEKANRVLKDKFNDKMRILQNNCVFDNANRIGSYSEYDMYINKTPVISSPNLYTKDSKTICVPVEYYGQVNPEVQKFL